MVLLLDVDFLVSRGLSHRGSYSELLEVVRQRTAVILPAFEPAAKDHQVP